MSPSPGLLLSLIVFLGVDLLFLSIVLALIWKRLRAIERAASRTGLEPSAFPTGMPQEPGPTANATTRQPDNDQPQPVAPRRHPGPPVVRASGSALRVDPAESSAFSGPTLIAVPKLPAAAPSQASATMTRDLGMRFGPIWELADAGETADAIARATGQPVGQVELILALRRQAMSVADGSRQA